MAEEPPKGEEDATEDYTKNIKVYNPVLTCIYCGVPHTPESPLGKEHIIPYSLGGRMVLPRASCTDCSKKTRDFETICARKMFGPLRIAMGLPTRNPSERPSTLSITELYGDGARVRYVDADDHPAIHFTIPQFAPSNLELGLPSVLEFRGRVRAFHAWKIDVMDSMALPAAPIQVRSHLEMPSFCKLLCKIAHSFAVGERGYKSHKWLLPDLIIGSSDNFSDYIGGLTELDLSEPLFIVPSKQDIKMQVSHTLRYESIRVASGRHFLTVVFQFFADFIPAYRIIVAEL